MTEAEMGGKQPCKNCPWRVGVTGRDIPGWTPELATNLAVDCQGDGLAVMACHKSVDGNEIPCVGFILQVGPLSIGLRLRHRRAPWGPDEYSAGRAELHPDFDAVLRASGLPVPARKDW